MAKTPAATTCANSMLSRPAPGAATRPALAFPRCLVPLLLATCQAAVAASYESVSNGAWRASCTWFVCPPGGAGYPDDGDSASVRHLVNFGDVQNVGTLVLTGTVQGSVASDTLNILQAGYWNSGTFEAGIYNNLQFLDITHAGPIGIQNLHGTLNNPVAAVVSQNSSFQMHNDGTVNNAGLYRITNDADIGNSVATGPVIRNSGTGNFSKTGGTGTSLVSGNIVFDNQGGTIAAQLGTLVIGRLVGHGGVLNAAPGATLRIQGMDVTGTFTGSGGGSVELSNGFQGAASFALPGGMLKWSGGNIGGALTNTGGLGIASGAGRLSGGTVVNLGSIEQSANFSMNANGTQFVNSGVFQVTQDASIVNGVAGTPVFSNTVGGSFAKVAGTGRSTVSGIVFDNQGLVTVSSGTLALSDVAQHPSGSTTLSAGTWEVKAGATLNLLSGGNIVTNQAQVSLSGVGSTFAKINALADNQGSFSILDGRNFTTAGDLLNSGMLTVGAGSVLTLGSHGTLTSTGTLRGAGTIVGNVYSSGRTAPGRSVGTLSIDGNLSLQAPPGAAPETGVLEIELAGVSSHDVLAVSGSAALAGVLKVDLLPGYLPTVGDSFAVLSFGSWSGGFQAYDLPALTGGLYLQPVLSADRLTLTVAVPEPASWAMMVVGAGALGWAMQRRRRHTARLAA